MKYKNIYQKFKFAKDEDSYNQNLKNAIYATRKITLEEIFSKLEMLKIYLTEDMQADEIHSLQNDKTYLKLKTELFEEIV